MNQQLINEDLKSNTMDFGSFYSEFGYNDNKHEKAFNLYDDLKINKSLIK